MATALRIPLGIIQMVTESAVRDGDIVIVGAADNKCAFPGGASPTTMLCGVVKLEGGSVAAVGDTVDVVVSGIYPVRAAGTIARRALVTSGGADGTAITEAAAAGTNVGVIGQATASGVSGDRIPVLINPFIKQGG